MTVPHIEIIAPAVVGGAALVAMTFTPADIVTILSAVGVLVATIATAVINIMFARMKVVASKVDTTLEKMSVVEGHVNSAATKAEGIIASQAAQIQLLRDTIDTQKQTAALLAQAVTAYNDKLPQDPKKE